MLCSTRIAFAGQWQFFTGENIAMRGTWLENLFFHRRDAVTRQLAVRAFADTTLFAQRFPANSVLAFSGAG